MQSAAFQLNKVSQQIKRLGRVVTVKSPELDDFGEPTSNSDTSTIKGLLHVYSSYQTASSEDAATTRKKSSPMLLCLWEDVKGLALKSSVLINGNAYTIGGILNVEEANLIAEVSLEKVQKSG